MGATIRQWDGLPISEPGVYAGVPMDAYHGQLTFGPSISSSSLRNVNAGGTDWDPPQHDARYLVWRPKAEHRVKTSGTRATTAGSDVQVIAKGKRLSRDAEDFRRRILAKDTGERIPKQTRWPRRKMRGRVAQQET